MSGKVQRLNRPTRTTLAPEKMGPPRYSVLAHLRILTSHDLIRKVRHRSALDHQARQNPSHLPDQSVQTRVLLLGATSLLDVFRVGGLVLADEVLEAVLGEPAAELEQLLAQTVDGLLVHVCLGDELRHGDWVGVSLCLRR